MPGLMLLLMAAWSAASETAVSAAVPSYSYSSLGGSVCCTRTAVGAPGFKVDAGAGGTFTVGVVGGAGSSLGFRVCFDGGVLDEVVLVPVFMLPLLGVVACLGVASG